MNRLASIRWDLTRIFYTAVQLAARCKTLRSLGHGADLTPDKWTSLTKMVSSTLEDAKFFIETCADSIVEYHILGL